MWSCTNCGAENEYIEARCAHCGGVRPAVETPAKHCTRCGRRFPARFGFCGACGVELVPLPPVVPVGSASRQSREEGITLRLIVSVVAGLLIPLALLWFSVGRLENMTSLEEFTPWTILFMFSLLPALVVPIGWIFSAIAKLRMQEYRAAALLFGAALLGWILCGVLFGDYIRFYWAYIQYYRYYS